MSQAPAHADKRGGITCNPYLLNGRAWPGDGTHAFLCFTPNGSEEPGQTVFQTIEHLPYQANEGTAVFAGNVLRQQGYIIYYFHDRPSAVKYLTAKYTSISQQAIQASTARCGATGYDHLIGQTITTSIFAYCHYDNPVPPKGADTVQNPGVGPTTAQESGHAYDFAIASLNNSDRTLFPSISRGFKDLVNADLRHAAAMAQCTAFSGTPPSQLETQLGATYGTPVCRGSTILFPYKEGPRVQNTLTILTEETPYFTNPPSDKKWFDFWAQNWAVKGQVANSTILPFMDYTIGTSQLYGCVATVMFSLANDGKLPNAIKQAYPSYCPPVTDSQITEKIP